MPRKQKLDTNIQEYMVVDDPAAIRLMHTPGYAEILKLVASQELSISDIARALEVNPGSVHYHLKELEKHGLVKKVREEIMGGVVRKFYRQVANNIIINTTRPGNETAANAAGFGDDYKEKMLGYLSYFGYDIPKEKMGEAMQILVEGDRRSKSALTDIQKAGLEHIEKNQQLISDTYMLAMLLRLHEDAEFDACLRRILKLCKKNEVA